jgi:hypothetical protein
MRSPVLEIPPLVEGRGDLGCGHLVSQHSVYFMGLSGDLGRTTFWEDGGESS